eukprot:2820144-Prymnesium_polylepis.2
MPRAPCSRRTPRPSLATSAATPLPRPTNRCGSAEAAQELTRRSLSKGGGGRRRAAAAGGGGAAWHLRR